MAVGADIVILFDGICEPVNPGGTGAWGWVLWIGTKRKLTGHGALGAKSTMTNNFAEYCALGFALKQLVELDLEINSLTILGDSQLVINQLNETWQMKSERLAPLRAKCLEYLEKLGVDWVARWIPRQINAEADEMSRRGYKDVHGKLPPERH
jgi:ribonuclease HI